MHLCHLSQKSMPNNILRLKICTFLLRKEGLEATTDEVYQYLKRKEKHAAPIKQVINMVSRTRCIQKSAPSTWRLDKTEYKRYLISLQGVVTRRGMSEVITLDLEEMNNEVE